MSPVDIQRARRGYPSGALESGVVSEGGEGRVERGRVERGEGIQRAGSYGGTWRILLGDPQSLPK